MTRLLVTGKHGQVGWELRRSLQCIGEVIAVDRTKFDLSQPQSLSQALNLVRPHIIVNAAAYTAVDKAESEEALANTVNAESPGKIAEWAADNGALFVHYSTDYVFDGTGTKFRIETDETLPLSAYGRSKLAGELAIQAAGGRYLILRTSWIYAARGQNFFLTILRAAKERQELRVVADQWGAPTTARLVADTTAHAIAKCQQEIVEGGFKSGIVHLAAAGETTWHGFASTILLGAKELGVILRAPTIVAINSSEYPTPARRPANSRLACGALERRFGVHFPDWHEALQLCIEEVVC